jgi:membrane protein DedA with SNARE-associated domain/glutathione synthase/RimK-type ligase-like ATP-grasp enzyme
LTEHRRIGLLSFLAVGAVVVVSAGATPALPSGREVVESVADGLGGWIWPFTGAIAFLETTIPPFSLFIPGEWALLFAGAVAGQGEIQIAPLVLLVWACSAAGDSVAFMIGRHFGRRFLLRHGGRLRVTEARLARVDGWFERYGPAAVALGRLVNFMRPLAPLVAGSTRFSYRRFLPWNLVGTALFSLLYCLLGYFFYRSYDDVVAALGRGSLVLLLVLGGMLAAVVAIRMRGGRRRGRTSRGRVLLTDGSGLTARQTATQLGAAGYEVHVLAPDRLCLARWTRHVRCVHRVPAYGSDPYAWLETALEVARTGFDVLLPTQEQVAVLSREAALVRATGAPAALPPFSSLRRVQDKVAACQTLAELDLPQPPTRIVRSNDELRAAADRFPLYVKTAIGTASAGVHYVTSRDDVDRVARGLPFGPLEPGVLVQQPIPGQLAMLQAVFREGELVAWHANVRVRPGVNGGAAVKRSVALPEARADVARLGRALEWHGALSLDAILGSDGPCYIDLNPRLVEPGNARRAGVDLTAALIATALGRPVEAPAAGRPGIITHQLLVALLGVAQRTHSRRAVIAEAAAAARRRGPYRDSREELTPAQGDPTAPIPILAAGAALLASPSTWRFFAANAVESYSLTPAAWRAICASPLPSQLDDPARDPGLSDKLAPQQ